MKKGLGFINVFSVAVDRVRMGSERISQVKWPQYSLLFLLFLAMSDEGLSAEEIWPSSILVDLGDLQVRFESRSFWTLYRIDYKGDRLGLDHFGSHYGSVVSFPEIGFIGSGHTENENEELLDVNLWIDDVVAPHPLAEIHCQTVRLKKRSRIKTLLLETRITAQENRILEEVVLAAEKETHVNRIYHFMHPWTPAIEEFAAELIDGQQISGTFSGDRGFRIDAPTNWSAVYDQATRKAAVTVVLDTPDGLPWKTWYWDVPDRYRKHYLVTFLNGTIPPDKPLRYKALTLLLEAEQETWVDTVISSVESAKERIQHPEP